MQIHYHQNFLHFSTYGTLLTSFLLKKKKFKNNKNEITLIIVFYLNSILKFFSLDNLQQNNQDYARNNAFMNSSFLY